MDRTLPSSSSSLLTSTAPSMTSVPPHLVATTSSIAHPIFGTMPGRDLVDPRASGYQSLSEVSRVGLDERSSDQQHGVTFSALKPSDVRAHRVSNDSDNPQEEMSSYTFLKNGKLYEATFRVQKGTGPKQKCVASRARWESLVGHVKQAPGLLTPNTSSIDITLEKADPSVDDDSFRDYNLHVDGQRRGSGPVPETFARSYFDIPMYKGGKLREPLETVSSETDSSDDASSPADHLHSAANPRSTTGPAARSTQPLTSTEGTSAFKNARDFLDPDNGGIPYSLENFRDARQHLEQLDRVTPESLKGAAKIALLNEGLQSTTARGEPTEQAIAARAQSLYTRDIPDLKQQLNEYIDGFIADVNQDPHTVSHEESLEASNYIQEIEALPLASPALLARKTALQTIVTNYNKGQLGRNLAHAAPTHQVFKQKIEAADRPIAAALHLIANDARLSEACQRIVPTGRVASKFMNSTLVRALEKYHAGEDVDFKALREKFLPNGGTAADFLENVFQRIPNDVADFYFRDADDNPVSPLIDLSGSRSVEAGLQAKFTRPSRFTPDMLLLKVAQGTAAPLVLDHHVARGDKQFVLNGFISNNVEYQQYYTRANPPVVQYRKLEGSSHLANSINIREEDYLREAQNATVLKYCALGQPVAPAPGPGRAAVQLRVGSTLPPSSRPVHSSSPAFHLRDRVSPPPSDDRTRRVASSHFSPSPRTEDDTDSEDDDFGTSFGSAVRPVSASGFSDPLRASPGKKKNSDDGLGSPRGPSSTPPLSASGYTSFSHLHSPRDGRFDDSGDSTTTGYSPLQLSSSTLPPVSSSASPLLPKPRQNLFDVPDVPLTYKPSGSDAPSSFLEARNSNALEPDYTKRLLGEMDRFTSTPITADSYDAAKLFLPLIARFDRTAVSQHISRMGNLFPTSEEIETFLESSRSAIQARIEAYDLEQSRVLAPPSISVSDHSSVSGVRTHTPSSLPRETFFFNSGFHGQSPVSTAIVAPRETAQDHDDVDPHLSQNSLPFSPPVSHVESRVPTYFSDSRSLFQAPVSRPLPSTLPNSAATTVLTSPPVSSLSPVDEVPQPTLTNGSGNTTSPLTTDLFAAAALSRPPIFDDEDQSFSATPVMKQKGSPKPLFSDASTRPADLFGDAASEEPLTVTPSSILPQPAPQRDLIAEAAKNQMLFGSSDSVGSLLGDAPPNSKKPNAPVSSLFDDDQPSDPTLLSYGLFDAPETTPSSSVVVASPNATPLKKQLVTASPLRDDETQPLYKPSATQVSPTYIIDDDLTDPPSSVGGHTPPLHSDPRLLTPYATVIIPSGKDLVQPSSTSSSAKTPLPPTTDLLAALLPADSEQSDLFPEDTATNTPVVRQTPDLFADAARKQSLAEKRNLLFGSVESRATSELFGNDGDLDSTSLPPDLLEAPGPQSPLHASTTPTPLKKQHVTSSPLQDNETDPLRGDLIPSGSDDGVVLDLNLRPGPQPAIPSASSHSNDDDFVSDEVFAPAQDLSSTFTSLFGDASLLFNDDGTSVAPKQTTLAANKPSPSILVLGDTMPSDLVPKKNAVAVKETPVSLSEADYRALPSFVKTGLLCKKFSDGTYEVDLFTKKVKVTREQLISICQEIEKIQIDVKNYIQVRNAFLIELEARELREGRSHSLSALEEEPDLLAGHMGILPQAPVYKRDVVLPEYMHVLQKEQLPDGTFKITLQSTGETFIATQREIYALEASIRKQVTNIDNFVEVGDAFKAEFALFKAEHRKGMQKVVQGTSGFTTEKSTDREIPTSRTVGRSAPPLDSERTPKKTAPAPNSTMTSASVHSEVSEPQIDEELAALEADLDGVADDLASDPLSAALAKPLSVPGINDADVEAEYGQLLQEAEREKVPVQVPPTSSVTSSSPVDLVGSSQADPVIPVSNHLARLQGIASRLPSLSKQERTKIVESLNPQERRMLGRILKQTRQKRQMAGNLQRVQDTVEKTKARSAAASLHDAELPRSAPSLPFRKLDMTTRRNAAKSVPAQSGRTPSTKVSTPSSTAPATTRSDAGSKAPGLDFGSAPFPGSFGPTMSKPPAPSTNPTRKDRTPSPAANKPISRSSSASKVSTASGTPPKVPKPPAAPYTAPNFKPAPFPDLHGSDEPPVV
jgi:hypothetical protein